MPEVFGVRLYMVGQSTGTFEDDRLFFIDVETGLATAVDVGDPLAIDALAYDPNHNILYGIVGGTQATGSSLYRINTTTGVGTLLFSGIMDGALGVGARITGLAYDHITDVLYAVGRPINVRLYTVDLSNGNLTRVGPASFGLSSYTRVGSLAINAAAGKLYSTPNSTATLSSFISIDVSTGIGTVIVETDPELREIGGLTYDYNNFILYGVSGAISLGMDPGVLYRIDIATGVKTRIGTTDNFGLHPTPHNFQGLGLAYMSLGRILNMPTGLALTEAGGDITADWNDVTDATGYVLEWREQGSGAAWQTANVSAPPHTFTP